MKPRIKLAMIYGSTREGRLVETVGRWAGSHIAAHGAFELDVIDPLALALPTHPAPDDPASGELHQRLEAADAFVIVVPEYNHGYPAPLKALIDAAYTPWQAKPVSFVSYGGLSGGLRAVEQLRQVFPELHAVTLRDGVCLPNVWEQFDAAGNLHAPARYERVMATMLERLQWWARALREARHAAPYAEVAA
ncbi:NAD(P)H-dependent oxidoreductase [Ectothiorhodospiraceae bacterium 2226]|nr:NAD(P)H-dependent oxidoreductase [Ectothiorhodospiraceae bacterium 2226]